MGSLFGGGGSTSTTKNVNNDLIKSLFTSPAGFTGTAGNALASLFGLNGSQAGTDAFNNWYNSTAGNFGLQQGMQAINGNQAARGLLNSGSTLKALNQFGQNYGATQIQNYMSNLLGLGNLGLGAGSLITQAGLKSKSQSSPGKGGMTGGLLSGIGNLLPSAPSLASLGSEGIAGLAAAGAL